MFSDDYARVYLSSDNTPGNQKLISEFNRIQMLHNTYVNGTVFEELNLLWEMIIIQKFETIMIKENKNLT